MRHTPKPLSYRKLGGALGLSGEMARRYCTLYGMPREPEAAREWRRQYLNFDGRSKELNPNAGLRGSAAPAPAPAQWGTYDMPEWGTYDMPEWGTYDMPEIPDCWRW